MSVVTIPQPLVTTSENASTRITTLAAHSFSDMVLLYEYANRALQYHPQQLQAELSMPAAETEADGFNFFTLMHATDVKLLRLLLADVEETELPEVNCRIMHKSGAYRTYKCKITHMAEQGLAMIEAFHMPVMDQTMEELMTARGLRSMKEEILQFGSFEFDLANNLGHWTDGLYELFGYKNERPVVTYELFKSHIVARDAELAVQDMLRAAIENGGYKEEFDIVTSDKVLKRIEVIGKCLYNDSGDMYKRIGIIRDITTQRTQETTISKIIDELQRSNKELEEFAYVASHDLQEPLRKISTFCGRLSEKFSNELNDEGKMYLERTLVSADNMRVLIDNLLEFSRVARVNTGFSEISMSFLLQQVENELELTIEETGTTIIAAGLPVLNASFSNMKQVFSNILGNAIKFRKPDVPPVINVMGKELTSQEIAAYKLSPAGGRYFKISICDNGIGFEAEYAERIFKIFQRLHGKADYPGSGIGLAICRKIIDHHKGMIWAENIPGKGACFNMILPEDPNKS